MKKELFLLSLFLLFGTLDRNLWASEEKEFSGKLRFEVGISGNPSPSVFPVYLYPSLQLWATRDLNPDLSLSLAGEARWQASSPVMGPLWSNFPTRNLLDLEAEDLSTSDGTRHFSLRLSRIELKWSLGRLDMIGGLFHPDWGVATFFRPTDYFYPRTRLPWEPGFPLASEALDVKCFLFDDLSLETAGRLLEDGKGDWVVRLVDKSVAYQVVPSYARMGGLDLLGLDLQALFPDFKVWAEGTYRIQELLPGETWTQRTTAILGASALVDETTLILEYFRDGTGQVLGVLSDGWKGAGYILITAGRGFPGKWKTQVGLAKSPDGGPFFLMSRSSWEFEPGWEAGLQVRARLGEDPGPLALFPWILGLAVAYGF